jgi:hypothetical protein
MSRTFLPLLLLPFTVSAQSLQPELVCQLAPALAEVSAMIMVDDAMWVLMDSGNPNQLYKVDRQSGEILRTLTIANATNTDWEAMATDDAFVYIGDIGNNAGHRTDLHFLRFPLEVLEDDDLTEVDAEILPFAYVDQTDLTPTWGASDWDCEAFVVMQDTAYLFTKSWLEGVSHLYAVPLEPGFQWAVRRATLQSQGLVTGASLHADGSSICLIGHTYGGQPLIWTLSHYPAHELFNGHSQRAVLEMPLAQTESIAWMADDSVYFAHEASNGLPPQLWKVRLDPDVGMAPVQEAPVVRPWPNPCTDRLYVDGPAHLTWVRLVQADGREVLRTRYVAGDALDVAHLAAGRYVLEMGSAGRVSRGQVVVVH